MTASRTPAGNAPDDDGLGGDEVAVGRARRSRRIVIWAVAITVVVAMVVYGLLPIFQPNRGPTALEVNGPLPTEPNGDIAGFAAQQPEWKPCAADLECTRVWAPLDWDDPAGERISLALVKQPATGGPRLGTLFVNPGGPGASGVQFLAGGAGAAVSAEVQRQYDVIAWDPRGVGDSTPVRCLDAAGMDDYLFGPSGLDDLEVGSDEWIAQAAKEAAEFGAACADETGPLLGNVGTNSTVQDLDMLRAIVGDDALNYFGYSYGTYIGAMYADRYPDRVGRLVLDGAMDPSTSLADVVREQTRSFEEALGRYVATCVSRDDCPFASLPAVESAADARGAQAAAMGWIGDLIERLDSRALTASDGRVLGSGTMITAIITPLYSADSAALLDALFTSVAAEDVDTAFLFADAYYDRVDGEYQTNSTEAFSAINCLDYPSDDDPARMRERAAELIEVAPTIGQFQGYGDIACAAWPVAGSTERSPVSAAGAAPMLVVGTTGDTATPYKWAESLAEQLESGVLLTYVGEGHTAYGESVCIDAAVDAYLLAGDVPDDGLRCES